MLMSEDKKKTGHPKKNSSEAHEQIINSIVNFQFELLKKKILQ